MLFNIIACALALLALLSAVVVWLTLARSLMLLTHRCSELERTMRETSPTHLVTELAALDGDVKALAINLRKQMGKVWAELHHEGVLKRNGASQSDLARVAGAPIVDGDLAAMIALQAGPGSAAPKE